MRNNAKYTERKERTIYIYLSPSDKKFYIGHCLTESLKETFRHNLKGRRYDSKDFFQTILPERPCVFILENSFCTMQQATNLMIVWTKILIERGYQYCNNSGLVDFTEELYVDNQKLYEERNITNLDELLSCERCAIPVYNKNICKNYPDVKPGEVEV